MTATQQVENGVSVFKKDTRVIIPERKLQIILYKVSPVQELLEYLYAEKVDKDYDFFEFEDKSIANDYSLEKLQEETKMMEEEDEEFRELIEQAMAANCI